MSNAKLEHKDGFRPKLIALSVAACFSVSATQTAANPTGATVVSGTAPSVTSGNTLTITNSANAIINWQSFSIGAGEITRFVQPSVSSAVLNRVVGAGGPIPQSVIDGVLSSNGRVFLINPSGVVISATGRVDVAGFVASSLNLSDKDFTDGRMRFTEQAGAGRISNAGLIDTSYAGPGGRVLLVGPDVQNSGIIRSPQGEIILAAGKSVELVSEGTPFVTVSITADSEQALNVGQLIADSGRIGMFGALVRQGGVAEANSAVVGANGEIRLVATQDLTLDAGSVTTANGPSGGNITLQAQGGTNLIYGTVEAKGSSGQGGTIEALGVRVGLLGYGIIDASGDAGGGTVLVGGDQHGANSNIQNAQQTLIGPDGVIRADAGTTGDGGRVIVWSDQATQFYGNISARGGSQSGDGGFVETSGNSLQAFGSVDTSAVNGKGGTWLLDPAYIQIVGTGNATLGCVTLPSAICFNDAPAGGLSQISPGTIDVGLRNNGYVTLQAVKDIYLSANLALTYGGNLTMQAGNNIDLGAFNISSTAASGTNFTLSANDAGAPPSGTGSIISTAGAGNITTVGGSVNLSGFGITVGNINTTSNTVAPGTVTVQAVSDLVTGAINASSRNANFGGSSVDLFSSSGKVTINGNIDTSGAPGSSAVLNNGTNGGAVTISSAGAATFYGGIFTYGGNGYGPLLNGPGGFGGSAGSVDVIAGASVLVQGNITATGGSGGTSIFFNLTGYAGGAGGLGGSVILSAGSDVTIGSGFNIDVRGGSGGAGSQAAAVTSPVPGGAGGQGGGAGVVELAAGQNVTVYGSVLATGGTGGAGGNGVLGSTTPGVGGAGGLGGLVFVSTSIGSGIVTLGTIRADGGAGGVGGAYGGAGGVGGNALAVLAYSPAVTLSSGSVITAYGGAGGAGGPNGPAFGNAAGGNGGNGGNGGDLILFTDSALASTALSVLGGAGGTGGAGTPAGVAGLAGLDGLITIGFNFNVPEVVLASNTSIRGTNQLALANNAPSVDDLQKKNEENKKKKEAAACR